MDQEVLKFGYCIVIEEILSELQLKFVYLMYLSVNGFF